MAHDIDPVLGDTMPLLFQALRERHEATERLAVHYVNAVAAACIFRHSLMDAYRLWWKLERYNV